MEKYQIMMQKYLKKLDEKIEKFGVNYHFWDINCQNPVNL